MIPDENAHYVLDTFILLANSKISGRQVWLQMRGKGMLVSHSQFYRLIRNPVYIGKIIIKSDKNKEPETIEALHVPIVPKTLFEKVQEKLDMYLNKIITKKNTLDYLFPLRGYIKCSICNRPLTARGSTGSNPNRKYYYYHCTKGCRERFSLKKAHELFHEYLEKIGISKLEFNFKKKEVKKDIQKQEDSLEKRKRKIKNQIIELKRTIANAEDRFFEGKIDPETFKSSKSRYLNKITDFEEKIIELKNFNPVFEFQLRMGKLKKLIDLPKKFEEADFTKKRSLLDSILKEKITLY